MNQDIISVKIVEEHGYNTALLGISLNKLQPVEKMPGVAEKLAHADAGSHRKFLRQLQVWLCIRAPMYWWAEFDTYKVGVVRNSSSTMHKPVEHSAESSMSPLVIKEMVDLYAVILGLYEDGVITIEQLKANMPAGVMLTSIVSVNYEVLRTILRDRSKHRLQSWRLFCQALWDNIEHPELLPEKEY